MNYMKYPIYDGDLTYLFVGQDVVPRAMEGGYLVCIKYCDGPGEQ